MNNYIIFLIVYISWFAFVEFISDAAANSKRSIKIGKCLGIIVRMLIIYWLLYMGLK